VFFSVALFGNYTAKFKTARSSSRSPVFVDIYLKAINLFLFIVMITFISLYNEVLTFETQVLVLLFLLFSLSSLISIAYNLIVSNHVVSNKTLNQLCFVFALTSLFWNMAVISPYTLKSSFYSIVFLAIGLIVFNTFFVVFLYMSLKARKKDTFSKQDLRNFIINNPTVYTVLIFIILFSVDIKVNPIFDSALYFKYISQMPPLFDFTPQVCFKLLQVVNHCAGVLSGYYLLGLFIFPFNHVVANILSLIIMVVAIFAFERALNFFYCGDDYKWQRAFGAAIFAFSPTIYGSSLKITPDLIVALFLIMMICSALYEYKILTVFFGICMIYSKTPAIIIYGSYILGILLFQIVVSLLKKTKSVVEIIKEYWHYVIPLISFGFWYYIMKDSIWIYDSASSVRHSLGFSKDIFYELFLQVFTVNFYWMFYTIITISLFAVVLQYLKIAGVRKVKNAGWIAVFIITFVGFFLFNGLYVTTYRHARYIAPLLLLNAFFVFCAIQYLVEKKVIKRVLLLMLSLLMITSTFRTYDPVLLSMFPVMRTENQVMSMYEGTSHYPEGGLVTDVMLYNREYVMIDKLYVDFLNKVDYGKEDISIFIDYHPFHAQFSGNPGHISYIRTENGRRTFEYDPDNEIKSISVTSGEFNEMVDLPEKAYFIRLWQQDETLVDIIKQKYIIEENIDIHRGNYYLHAYKVILKDTVTN